MNKLKVGILGATGMVGQKFVSLLEDHPWFEVVCVASSQRSAGKKYKDVMRGRWIQGAALPQAVGDLRVQAIEEDLGEISDAVDLVFSAFNLEESRIREIEERYAAVGVPVISNNAAHRWTRDVPMILPEVNSSHLDLIATQKKERGWGRGLIVAKPNCSIQSYVPALDALRDFGPREVVVTTLQAISGAGKTLDTYPEIIDNTIPFIGGEEEKSEKEPLKVWGSVSGGKLEAARVPRISATCTRVAVSDGHMATVNVRFAKKPTREQILRAWREYAPLASLHLPSAPDRLLKYCEQEERPQTRLDRDYENGMGITIGRLRADNLYDWKFVCLSHNTVRGAAGGAILAAELLKTKKYF